MILEFLKQENIFGIEVVDDERVYIYECATERHGTVLDKDQLLKLIEELKSIEKKLHT